MHGMRYKMTHWKNIHLTRQIITGGSLTINAVYPPEFESNIADDIQNLKTVYHCQKAFKKEVISLICSYDGRLVSFNYS